MNWIDYYKKAIVLLFVGLLAVLCYGQNSAIPLVLNPQHTDLIAIRLRDEAAQKSALFSIPSSKADWLNEKEGLKKEIFQRADIRLNHELPLAMETIGNTGRDGYRIEKITFQTLPGVFTTANLYVPEGDGKFPAVVLLMGHWSQGRLSENFQLVAHQLASNGYVCLCPDPWGYVERTTVHGNFEDHGDGNNLGISLSDIGEPLIGLEISENIRAVDLLCSLPYVDQFNIGVTGASGGGNHTMWLAAIDERIKAAVPVVSVGTFESYIMGSPCICEVLPGALNLMEESAVLSMIAPRAIRMCNHTLDRNQAFQPAEMQRSFSNAWPVFNYFEAGKAIDYKLFELKHHYFPADCEAMLDWFDQYLKSAANHSFRKDIPFAVLPKEELMVFPYGKRSADIVTTDAYCLKQGERLHANYLDQSAYIMDRKREELRLLLGITVMPEVKTVHRFEQQQGWDRVALEITSQHLIPVLLKKHSAKSNSVVLFCSSGGKGSVPGQWVEDAFNAGKDVALADLSGTGELLPRGESLPKYNRIVSRSLLWLGRTTMGEWARELTVVARFLKQHENASSVSFEGVKDAGMAALYANAVSGEMDEVVVHDAPVSYRFDQRDGIDSFNEGIHVPGILKWGDVSLLAALSGKQVRLVRPVTISGHRLNPEDVERIRKEFELIKERCHSKVKYIIENQ